jgi:hypothetical protein
MTSLFSARIVYNWTENLITFKRGENLSQIEEISIFDRFPVMLHNQKIQDDSIKCQSRQSQEPSERKSHRERERAALDLDVFFKHLKLVKFPGFRRLFENFPDFRASHF